MIPPPRRPQQQRAEDTRRRILERAEARFARDGYAGTSLAALAEDLGIHKPGIFYYFESKRALYEAVVVDAVGALEDELTGILSSRRPPRERLLEAVASWVDAIAARPTLARLLLHEVANPDSATTPSVFPEVGERIQARMTKAIRELHPDVSPDELLHYFSLMTGATLLYSSPMQRLRSRSRAASRGASMEQHKKLLIEATRDFLRRLASRST
jgi:AcrR family transcriptional regulator